jgi:putative transcriptional regulator
VSHPGLERPDTPSVARTILHHLPDVLVLGLLLGATAVWALGEPDTRLMVLDASAVDLPVSDLPCEGNLLMAHPGLRDPEFGGAVVLLCHHDANGALGILLNRRADVLAKRVLGYGTVALGQAVAGGPVGRGQGIVVYRRGGDLRFTTVRGVSSLPWAGWLRAPRVPLEDVRVVALGHAGWGPGQLDKEIQAGAWSLTDVELESYLAGSRAPAP